MPTISMFFGILIRMFFNEHAPPHFHAEYSEFKAIIDIQTLEVIEGKLPRRALELVLDWGRWGRRWGQASNDAGVTTTLGSGFQDGKIKFIRRPIGYLYCFTHDVNSPVE